MKAFIKKLSVLFAMGALVFGSGLLKEGTKVVRAAESTITISYNDTFSPAFPDSSGNTSDTEHTDETSGITFKERGIYKKTSYSYLMFASGKGFLYNTESLGTINSVVVSYSGGTSESAKIGVYFGSTVVSSYTTSSNKTIAGKNKSDTFNNTVQGNGYFQVSTSNKNCQITKIVINYEKVSTRTLSDIALSGSYKTAYKENETFDTTGLTVTATYSDGSTADVTSKVTVAPSGALTSNDSVVTVSYTESGVTKTKKINITVAARTLESISVKTNPTKMSYYSGETLDLTGLVLTATYNDGNTLDITSGWDAIDYTFTDEDYNNGSKIFTITYSGKTTTLTVSVVEKPKAIIDDGMYYIKAVYNNNEYVLNPKTYSTAPSASVFSTTSEAWKFTNKNDLANLNAYSISYFNEDGEEIYLYATDTNNGVRANADNKNHIWTISKNENGTYKLTTSANASRMLAIYINGSNPQDWRTYTGKSDTNVVDVILEKLTTLTSVTYIGDCKKNYAEGENFDPSGLTFTANYGGQDSKVLSAEEVSKIEWSELSVNSSSVTGTYSENGITVSFTIEGITVSARELVSISITSGPTKTKYYVGETFDASGMVIMANYNIGESVEITEECEFSNTTLSVPGNQEITVSYKGQTASFIVVVTRNNSGYVLVKSLDDINDGDTIIITNKSYEYGLGTNGGSFSNKIDTSITRDRFTLLDEGIKKITVIGNQTDGYNLLTDEGYLCLNSDGNNLHKSETIEGYLWNFVYDSDDGVQIQSRKFTNRYIQYNASSPRFACYKDTQESIAIFKLVNNYDYLVYGVLNTNTCANPGVDESTIENQSEINLFKEDVADLSTRYEELTDEEKALFNSTLCDDNGTTLSERLDFLKYRSDLFEQTENISSNLLTNLTSSNNTLIVLIVGLLGLTSILGYYFLNKKKYSC